MVDRQSCGRGCCVEKSFCISLSSKETDLSFLLPMLYGKGTSSFITISLLCSNLHVMQDVRSWGSTEETANVFLLECSVGALFNYASFSFFVHPLLTGKYSRNQTS